jgi:hypothetical protein
MNLLSAFIQRYEFGFQGLRRAISHRASVSRGLAAVLNLLAGRLGRTLLRLDRLVVRWQAGEDMTPRARSPRVKPVAAPRAEGVAPQVLRLPTGQMWLTKILQPVAQPILQWSSAVNNLLDDAESKALVAAVPQAGRLLRPLCRLFGTEVPEYLRLPKRVRKPRAPRAPKASRPPKPRKERQGPVRGLIPSPVISDSHYGFRDAALM